MDLLEVAKRIRRGVKLLDRKIPNWRTVMRRHQDQFDFSDGDYCILGTLEHYSKRMQQLKTKNARDLFADRFNRAYPKLGIDAPEAFGFDVFNDAEPHVFDDLWRAEFEKVEEAK